LSARAELQPELEVKPVANRQVMEHDGTMINHQRGGLDRTRLISRWTLAGARVMRDEAFGGIEPEEQE
jgi:hypothetical protein